VADRMPYTRLAGLERGCIKSKMKKGDTKLYFAL